MSRTKIIELASAEIGVTEMPPNSNLQKFGKWFGFDGAAWCGIFCSWAYDQAGHSLGKMDFWKGFASVPFAYGFYSARNKLTTDPKPADMVIYDWPGNKEKYDHVGLFEHWIDRGKGLFSAIEGNTSPTNQSNGGSVMRRQRDMKNVVCFVDPLNLPL